MKVYIHTDIEGVAGWVFYANAASNSLENHAHLHRMNRLLTGEVEAAARAALDSGAEEVWINDSHGPAYSILFEELPAGCQVLHGRPGYFDAWLAGFDASVDALLCVGMHAMAGTPHAVCPHSVWHVNGGAYQLSEASMAAALAGYHDVPCVCVTGDDKVCAEIQDKIPGCEAAVVKWGIAAQNARTLVPAVARELIYQAVRRGLARREQIPPFVIPGPYRLNVSDRDPAVRLMPEDAVGEDFWEVAHRAMNSYGNHFGEDPLDDRSFRWPG